MITKHVIGIIVLLLWDALQTFCSLSEIHQAPSVPPSHTKSDFGTELMLLQFLEQRQNHKRVNMITRHSVCVSSHAKSEFDTEPYPHPHAPYLPPPTQNLSLIQSPSSSRPSSGHDYKTCYRYAPQTISSLSKIHHVPYPLPYTILFWYRANVPQDPRTPLPHNRATMITKQAIGMIFIVFSGALQTICPLFEIHHSPPQPSHANLVLVYI